MCGNSHDESWNFNLSAKRFKTVIGDAVKADPFCKRMFVEWKRKVEGRHDDAICNPEDVRKILHGSTMI